MTSNPESDTKYGHLSLVDPDFGPTEHEVTEAFQRLWKRPLSEIRDIFLKTPPQLPKNTPTDLDISHQMVPVSDGTRVEICVYKSRTVTNRVPLYFVTHGGGWISGGHSTEEAHNRIVAGSDVAVVVSVDYRMAPEYPYPYAVNDSFDVLQWCKANANLLDIDPDRIFVGGGSAGGNIAAVLAQKARDEGFRGIIGQVLNIPILYHPKHFPTDKYEYTSYKQNQNAPIVDEELMYKFWDNYLPNRETDVYASPLLANSLKNLPPALIQVAGMDPLRDEGLPYAEGLKSAGIRVTLMVYPGLPHGFYVFPDLDASSKYFQSVVYFIKENSH